MIEIMNVKNEIKIKTNPKEKVEILKDEISDERLEIKKMLAIVEEKELNIKLIADAEFQKEREEKLILVRAQLTQMVDDMAYFKNTSPFNHNITFLKNLDPFYKFLEEYENSEAYLTQNSEFFGQERHAINLIKKKGKYALSILGDETYRFLLRTFTERFTAIEKTLTKLTKKVSKIG